MPNSLNYHERHWFRSHQTVNNHCFMQFPSSESRSNKAFRKHWGGKSQAIFCPLLGVNLMLSSGCHSKGRYCCIGWNNPIMEVFPCVLFDTKCQLLGQKSRAQKTNWIGTRIPICITTLSRPKNHTRARRSYARSVVYTHSGQIHDKPRYCR